MRPSLVAVFCASLLAPLPALGDAPGQARPAILTIIGGSEANRGPADRFLDAFFSAQDIAFDAALALDRQALAAMPQTRITANGPGWPEPMTLSGPLLTEVIAKAGIAQDVTLLVTALDGYVAEISAADRAAATWIVAIEVEGQPLSLGGRGPTWILPDTGGLAVGEGEDANWVWAAYLMSVAE
ncbi:MAG: hypothetical protein AAF577_13135 [Pseudomonadota bacterium]